MYPSPIRITLYPGTANERRILDWGDALSAPVALPLDQQFEWTEALSALFSSLRPAGNLDLAMSWEAMLQHSSAADAAVRALDGAAAMRALLSGARIDLANPLLGPDYPDSARTLVTWIAPQAVLESADHGTTEDAGSTVRGKLHIGSSDAAIADPLPDILGIVETSAAVEDGAGIVRHDGQAWLRVRVSMPEEFTGNAVDGWTDAAGQRHIYMQHSTDLATWATGKMIQAPGVSDVVAGGVRHTWVESEDPQDAEELVSDQRIWWQRPEGSNITAWTYAQEITSLLISGAFISLPHFPYTIPGCAAQLQTDLRAAGYAGALVSDDPGAEMFMISLFDIPTADYNHTPGGVASPGFQYRDTFGDLRWSGVMWASYFNPRFGTAHDPFTIYMRQFARAKVTRL